MTNFNVSTASKEERAQFFGDMAIESLTEARKQDSEIWKPIKDTNGMYEVSNLGRARSNKRNYGILKPSKNGHGYPTVEFYIANRGKSYYIHRLVAETFITNPQNKPCINHKDGDKTNNTIWNLEWCSVSENTQHAYDNNLMKKGKDHVNCTYSLIVLKDGAEIAKLYGKNAWIEYGLSPTCVHQFFSGKIKTHKGYTFRKEPLTS